MADIPGPAVASSVVATFSSLLVLLSSRSRASIGKSWTVHIPLQNYRYVRTPFQIIFIDEDNAFILIKHIGVTYIVENMLSFRT